jgi:hypothetical protein
MSKFKVGDKVKRISDLDIFMERTGSSGGVVTGLHDVYISFDNKPSSVWDGDHFELVEEWSIYNNTLPLSELSDEQRGLLFNHHFNGGGIVNHHGHGSDKPTWASTAIYRAKQKSERELFVDAALSAAKPFSMDVGIAKAIAEDMFIAGFKAPKTDK